MPPTRRDRRASRSRRSTAWSTCATSGDLEAVRGVLEAALGSDAPMVRGAAYLEADICRGDLLVEIEAHATAPGRRRD